MLKLLDVKFNLYLLFIYKNLKINNKNNNIINIKKKKNKLIIF